MQSLQTGSYNQYIGLFVPLNIFSSELSPFADEALSPAMAAAQIPAEVVFMKSLLDKSFLVLPKRFII
jgi:hypothetical protein